MDIGKKIKALRLKQDLTIDELAQRCELTKGFISQLERDLTSPSIETLQDIISVLNCSLSDFFKDDEKNKSYVFSSDAMSILEETDYHIKWLIATSQAHNMEPILITLKAGKSSPKVNPFIGEVFGLVLTGRVVVIVGNKQITANAGDAFHLEVNEEHYLKNNMLNGDSKVLWITTPPRF
ncbi:MULTISPECIES: helix-turn-helix domain-containing protein [unclassified Spiroplasma]|uniref:helix-turn-helix domain-containing protein n=1 Tax=unclassified Spiroplasma TaxID=2637901 RepID=UPI0030D42783